MNGSVEGAARGPRMRALFAATLVLAVLAGCGGDDGANQEALDQARAEGAKEAREQARVKELQRQVKQLQRQQKRNGGSGGNPGSGGAGSGPAYAPASGPARTCSGGVGASSATSCDFAMNVAGEYGSNPDAATISAYSPVTGQHYTMNCAAMSGWSAVCTGGNNAAVFIP